MSTIQLVEVQTDTMVIGTRIIKMKNGVAAGFHRTTLEPGQDGEVVAAAVDADLKRLGFDPVVNWLPFHSMAAATHTPEVVGAFLKAEANAKTELAALTAANVAAADAGT